MPLSSPPSPPRPDRAARTRAALLEAASTLFVSRGYEETTMADIAAEAGASRRTVFNYFPTKGDIPMLWVRQMADRAIEDAMGEAAPSDLVVAVRAYFRSISEAVESTPELSRQMMLGWTAALGPTRYESQLLADVTPYVEAARDRGQVDPTVDVADVARALSDVLQGAVFRWVREPETVLHERVDAAVTLVLRGITVAVD
ncbi:TetR/AcrR family transcriptional regulator [Nocardioides zeae]|uniref:AcrR family transcriptional regulator n=1 Tax=Nocardioides zeae TaxID=1457234 RepID=A0AAJ1X2A0_9ACTN|nr:TetR/AcrR family transcriptional regulator [Nocardioides zeae]MDQ1105681.1 AcrR family transcriptional regulator [Nocardioides zeae]